MSINYSQKQNERSIGQELPISSEPHTVGIVGVSTVEPNMVKLIEVPLQSSPSSTVIIPGYSETTNPVPGNGQFYVDYINGYLTFNPSANGNHITVSYYGRGSEIDSVDINELQEPVGIALDIDGTVTPNSLIFGVASAANPSFIPVSDVDTHTGLVITATATVTVTLPSPTDTTIGRFFTVLNRSTSTNSISINGNVLLIGYGATWLWDGSAWILISPIPGVNGVPVVASDPSSPFLGQIYFNSTSNQFIGWNGSSWAILG